MAEQEKAEIAQLLFRWRWAVLRSELPAPSRLILHTLGFHMDGAGDRCQVGLTALHRETGLGQSTLKRHLSSLEADGWVRVERSFTASGDPDANGYCPAIPDGTEVGPEQAGVGPERAEGRPRAGGGVGPERAPNSRKNSRANSKRVRSTYPDAFESVWAIHHRGPKKKAFEEWGKAVPDLISDKEIEAAIRAYVLTFAADFAGAHLFRWIRDRRWEEGFETPTTKADRRLSRV